MKRIAICIAMALGSSVAMAQASGAAGAGVGNTGAGNTGAANVGDPHAGEYWGKTAKDGYMTPDQAMAYRTKDGKAYMDKSGKEMDMKAVDADSDGRISKIEWNNYFGGEVRGAGTPAAGNPTANPAQGGTSTR